MSDTSALEARILELMRRRDARPETARELLRRLKIHADARASFRRALRRLLSDKAIIRVGRNRFGIATPAAISGDGGRASGRRVPRSRQAPFSEESPASRPATGAGHLIGQLQIHPRGFGFVTPDGRGRDLFIPPPGIGDRRDGDRVEVRIVREQSDGRLEGQIVRVVERTRRKVVGVYRVERAAESRWSGAAGIVEAFDRRFEGGIVIPVGKDGGAAPGLVVGVEIDSPPQEERRAIGHVVEVLGAPEAPGTDLQAVILKYGLRRDFPEDVMAQANEAPDRITPADLVGREDFRRLPIVTIDGETAMDFDDAMHVARNADGTWELQVHIADVAHYVPAANPLDREAYERGTSVYFPGTALPMLPHRLSNGICSLNPGVDRLVQSCIMTIDGQGQVTRHRLVRGVIRSAARMTYTKVAKILVDHDAALMQEYREQVVHFMLMEELCGVLNGRRRRRGSIDFDLPEPEVILAITGEMTGIIALERNIAHRLIEEFMLAANETVAQHLWKAKVPAVYRIHERPDPRRLEDFDATAQAFGYSLPRPLTSIEPKAFQALLERASGHPEERFLSRLMLRSMKQARYSDKRDIHFGLASSCYTHFTSPIRRYPDLLVHRIVQRLLTGAPLTLRERGDQEEFLPEAAARSSFRERTADAAENELVERKKMTFMAAKVGEEFDGFVGRVEAFGLFVELRDLFVEGLIAVENLPEDRYRFNERRHSLHGERRGRVFGLGDPVRVRLAKVDAYRLEIDFELISSQPGVRTAGGAAPHRASSTYGGERGGALARGAAGARIGPGSSGASGTGGGRGDQKRFGKRGARGRGPRQPPAGGRGRGGRRGGR